MDDMHIRTRVMGLLLAGAAVVGESTDPLGALGAVRTGRGNCNRRNHYCGADDNAGKPIATPDRPARNAICPCGSGKKFKKCCLGGSA